MTAFVVGNACCLNDGDYLVKYIAEPDARPYHLHHAFVSFVQGIIDAAHAIMCRNTANGSDASEIRALALPPDSGVQTQDITFLNDKIIVWKQLRRPICTAHVGVE